MENLFTTSRVVTVVLSATISLWSCSEGKKSTGLSDHPAIIEQATVDSTSPYYADYSKYPVQRDTLPIGMFDSGTGGLTIMEAFLALDDFNNETGEPAPDGKPDFSNEKFVFLADQANMPYGVYNSEGKGDYLRELVVKDALFLTTAPVRTKIVVIACNTATAYGLGDIEYMFEKSNTGLSVIGVINAGTKALADNISFDEGGAVGVMATVGTIASGSYDRTIRKTLKEKGFTKKLEIINQPGLGFAEAVDTESNFIDPKATAPRDLYKGPKIGTDSLSINPDLLDVYKFDTKNNALLVTKSGAKYTTIQLNSPGNYARLHLVNLIKKLKQKNAGVKLSNIILGCTHYPYFKDTLKSVLDEMRNYSKNGVYPYKDLISEEVTFIDPAKYVARETYLALKGGKLLSPGYTGNRAKCFITVPAKGLDSLKLDKNGNLRYEYKYGRDTLSKEKSFEAEMFSSKNIQPENVSRIKKRLPLTFELIKNFIENDF